MGAKLSRCLCTRPLSILCIHGYSMTAYMMEKHLAKMTARFGPKVRFTFIQARPMVQLCAGRMSFT